MKTLTSVLFLSLKNEGIVALPVAAIRSFVLNTHPSWEKRLMLIPKDNP